MHEETNGVMVGFEPTSSQQSYDHMPDALTTSPQERVNTKTPLQFVSCWLNILKFLKYVKVFYIIIENKQRNRAIWLNIKRQSTLFPMTVITRIFYASAYIDQEHRVLGLSGLYPCVQTLNHTVTSNL